MSAKSGQPQPFAAGIEGLSSGEVAALRERAPAPRAQSTTRPYLRIIVDNAFPAANVALIAIAIILLALGLFIDALFTAGLVVGNIAVGMFQEIRAKRQLDRVAVLAQTDATVIRDGREQTVPPGEIVDGDVVLITAGDQAHVGGVVVAADRFALDESLLTGESDLVTKRVGDPIFSGSFCMRGRGMYRYEQGDRPGLAERVTGQAREFRSSRTPLQREVGYAMWSGVVLVGLLSIAVVRSFQDLYGGLPVVETTRAAAVIVALIPQGLWVMVTVTYGMAIIRLAPRGTLVQRLNAVESMSHVDVLCLDKTGTITTNTLLLEALRPVASDEPALRDAFGTYCASISIGNRSTEAIAAALDGRPATVVDEVQFESARKWSAAVLERDGNRELLVLGAPEVLTQHASSYDSAPVDELTRRGLRVLLLARSESSLDIEYEGDEPRLPDRLLPLGYAVLRDELRVAARETIREFLDTGITLKVISGDHPATVSALATEAGIPSAGRYISGVELETRNDEELARIVAETAVFGRIGPEQKAKIVESLQSQGHYVAMIGDGVNDVPAMKRARLGIAMRAGTAVTRGIADMILLQDSFAALPAAFREGRRIRAGMATVVRLFLTRTLTVLLVILGVSLAASEFPLTPRHTALQSALAVGVPAFFIALWTRPAITDKYLIPPSLRFVIPASVTLAGAGIAVYELGLQFSDVPHARTVLTLVLVVGGIFLIPFVDDEPPGWFTWRGLVSPLRTLVLAAAMLVITIIVEFVPARGFYELKLLGFGDSVLVGASIVVWAVVLAATWRSLDEVQSRLERKNAAPPAHSQDQAS